MKMSSSRATLETFRLYLEFTRLQIYCDDSSISLMFTTHNHHIYDCKILRRRGSTNVPAGEVSCAPSQKTGAPGHVLSQLVFPLATPNSEPRINIKTTAVLTKKGHGTAMPCLQLSQRASSRSTDYTFESSHTGSRPNAGAGHKTILRGLAETTKIEPSGLLVQMRREKGIPKFQDNQGHQYWKQNTITPSVKTKPYLQSFCFH